MNRYEKKYLDGLMKNNWLNSESESEYNINQKGGNRDEPYGGFPPIYICDKAEIKEEKENINREYSKHNNALSIKQIMESRKDKKTFI